MRRIDARKPDRPLVMPHGHLDRRACEVWVSRSACPHGILTSVPHTQQIAVLVLRLLGAPGQVLMSHHMGGGRVSRANSYCIYVESRNPVVIIWALCRWLYGWIEPDTTQTLVASQSGDSSALEK
jgi:hypothetical protein